MAATNPHYDYLIVGSGLFGAVFAYEATRAGKKCLVIDKRNHLGGNVYCENIADINVHVYGPHIFHTNSKRIWDYVNQFTTFNRFTNSPLANYYGELFNLPINMNTFYQFWKITSPTEARQKISDQISKLPFKKAGNLQEQALLMVGPEIYEKLIRHYTEKQWGRDATRLPASIIKRLPVRYNYDNCYFDDTYQGVPVGGYNKLVAKLLAGIDFKTGVDFNTNRYELTALAKKVIYTGAIDAYFDHSHGHLEYRSLQFKTEVLDMENFQGNAVVNYCDPKSKFTRIVEHKHFEFGRQSKTVITREYPVMADKNVEPYYPINDDRNNAILKKYQTMAAQNHNVVFGGRLAEYKYYDMHQVIASALKVCNRELYTAFEVEV
ncbi:UDP-galactopyranose mutase [Mucilaginibacter pedocola]|uniref:UDP-galactopyranose mutase n=1 Tax=Mucilaginibacter pedocola TaxID=1792845 RepID=A0A1S9P729_9SPHI|nr:UDP-galactopyranose mutase [Mucilaginibacter pedocola]OOQ56755.1 UDP-galactopyranose mutase [Mucilaginibacter pedocola]